jgi:RNA polymerase sigma-70 factor (ECF subfamily)
LKRQKESENRDTDGGRARDFELVAMPHTESLLRMALRLVRGDRAAADDLVQEAFLQAWRAFDQFERGTNCRGWLFRILFNLSNRRNEQLRARPALVSTDDVPTSNVVPLYSKPRQLEAAEVLEAFDRLPEDQQGGPGPARNLSRTMVRFVDNMHSDFDKVRPVGTDPE